jgi:hypothetical protein
MVKNKKTSSKSVSLEKTSDSNRIAAKEFKIDNDDLSPLKCRKLKFEIIKKKPKKK